MINYISLKLHFDDSNWTNKEKCTTKRNYLILFDFRIEDKPKLIDIRNNLIFSHVLCVSLSLIVSLTSTIIVDYLIIVKVCLYHMLWIQSSLNFMYKKFCIYKFLQWSFMKIEYKILASIIWKTNQIRN